jgi:hypothetical protein
LQHICRRKFVLPLSKLSRQNKLGDEAMRPSSNRSTKKATDLSSKNGQEACLVVFVDKTECRILKGLKPGFRHCFVALRREDQWIICDSLKNHMELFAIDAPFSFDLGKFYCDCGHVVVQGRTANPINSSMIIPDIFTCVAIAKRIIGIRSILTFTPWQLFRLLRSKQDQWELVG